MKILPTVRIAVFFHGKLLPPSWFHFPGLPLLELDVKYFWISLFYSLLNHMAWFYGCTTKSITKAFFSWTNFFCQREGHNQCKVQRSLLSSFITNELKSKSKRKCLLELLLNLLLNFVTNFITNLITKFLH